MGLRFRKSIGKGPLRVNISKKGVGASIGGKGYRFTKKAGGGFRSTASITSTGISHVSESSKGRKNHKSAPSTYSNIPQYSSSTLSASAFILKILSIFMLVVGFILTFAVPAVGIIAMIIGVLEAFGSRKYKKQAKIKKTIEEENPENQTDN